MTLVSSMKNEREDTNKRLKPHRGFLTIIGTMWENKLPPLPQCHKITKIPRNKKKNKNDLINSSKNHTKSKQDREEEKYQEKNTSSENCHQLRWAWYYHKKSKIIKKKPESRSDKRMITLVIYSFPTNTTRDLKGSGLERKSETQLPRTSGRASFNNTRDPRGGKLNASRQTITAKEQAPSVTTSPYRLVRV